MFNILKFIGMKKFDLILRTVESRLSFSLGKTIFDNYPYFRLYDVDDIITKDIIDEVCSVQSVEFLSVGIDENHVYALFKVSF